MAKNHKNDNNAFLRDKNIEKQNLKQDKIQDLHMDKTLSDEASVFLDAKNNESAQNSQENQESFDQETGIQIAEEKTIAQPTEAQKAETKKEKRKRKKEERQKRNKKTTLSHKIKVLSTLMVLGVFTGSGLGVWYFNVNLKSPDYGAFVADTYIKPINKVMSENFGITSQEQINNWLDYAGDNTPATIKSHVDNVLLAIHNASLAKNFVFTGNGKAVSMGITQTVYSQRRHIDDIYTFESISKGTGKISIVVANLDYYKKDKKNDKEVRLYTGKNVSQRNADWYYSKTVSTDEYQSMTGGLPNKITPYIISEKTVTSSNMTNDENGNYVFTFTLDPMTSVLNYYKEVRRTGGLEADPEFSSIKFIATIDSRWNLITTEVFETYKAVKFGMGVTCNGTIKIDYQFNLPEVLLPEIKG